MDKILQTLIEEIPDYREFMTLAEMDESSRQLVQKHPESAELFEMGRTRQDRPLLCLKIGHGSKNALLFGCPHPNEPIGAMMLEYFSQRLAADWELRERFDYTWYIIKAWDADGLVKNEGWLKGPYNIFNYGRNFFRPAGCKQVDWTFPIDYGKLHFHDVLPETQAMMDLIDQIRPEFIYALHNSGFGGVYWYESEPTPDIYEALHAIPRNHQLPLSLGVAESASCQEYAPAIFQCTGIKSEYDFLEKYGSPEEKARLSELKTGDNSASYAYDRCKAFTLLTELPYFYDPRVEDTSPSDMTRLEALRQGMEDDKRIHRDLRRILDLSKKWLPADDPYIEAVVDFSRDGGDAALNQAQSDPAFQKPASKAEKLDHLVTGKFYKMILYGMLVRANEEELAKTDAAHQPEKRAALQKGFDEALLGLSKITQFLEDHLSYSVVPICNLIAVQLESGLVVMDHLRHRRE